MSLRSFFLPLPGLLPDVLLLPFGGPRPPPPPFLIFDLPANRSGQNCALCPFLPHQLQLKGKNSLPGVDTFNAFPVDFPPFGVPMCFHSRVKCVLNSSHVVPVILPALRYSAWKGAHFSFVFPSLLSGSFANTCMINWSSSCLYFPVASIFPSRAFTLSILPMNIIAESKSPGFNSLNSRVKSCRDSSISISPKFSLNHCFISQTDFFSPPAVNIGCKRSLCTWIINLDLDLALSL